MKAKRAIIKHNAVQRADCPRNSNGKDRRVVHGKLGNQTHRRRTRTKRVYSLAYLVDRRIGNSAKKTMVKLL